MGKWVYTLDIMDAYQKIENDEITWAQLAKVIAEKLEHMPKTIMPEDSLDNLIINFQDISKEEELDSDDFDNVMKELYDYADGYRIWVKTF